MGNPLKLRGYEKFWNALVAGNILQVPIVMTFTMLYYVTGDATFKPTTEVVIACVSIFWGSLFAAIGAYLATNSPVENPDTGNSEVQVSLPVTTPNNAQGELPL